MTSAAETPKISADDYLAGEAASPVNHEYLDFQCPLESVCEDVELD